MKPLKLYHKDADFEATLPEICGITALPAIVGGPWCESCGWREESMFKVDMEAHDWFARSYDKGKSFAPNPQAFLNLDSRSLFQLEF